MVNINDVSQYKRCQKKKYNIWVCMPQMGSCVINKLEQAQVVKELNGKTYFTVTDMNNLREENPKVYEFLCKNAYLIDEKKRFVLSGTQGELWTIDANKLAKTYVFGDGSPITEESLKARMKKDMAPAVMDWQLLESKGSGGEYNFACHVPANNLFQIQTAWGSVLNGNDPILGHGKGDFIVCAVNADGSPNISDRWIVNGLIFGDTYDNRGWSDKLVQHKGNIGDISVEKPKFTLIDERYRINVSQASKVIPELKSLVLNGELSSRLSEFTRSKCEVRDDNDQKGQLQAVYLDFNYSEDLKNGKLVPKVNQREARITLNKKFNSAFLILKVWNSHGKLHDQFGGKIRFTSSSLDSYKDLTELVNRALSTIKLPSNSSGSMGGVSGNSSKERAKNILNLFGKK